ncbi:MAG: hypothetical protein GTO41_02285, partial [Burkholderiales bacterium]|nr:hypothetical protein [Burkholderiales bacterium]
GRRIGEAEKISFTLGLVMQRKPNDKPFQKGLFDLLREHIQGTVMMVDEIEHEALLAGIGEGSWGGRP